MEPVPECQSPLFLHVDAADPDDVRLYFSAPAEAPTTRGFAAILASGLDHQPAADILAVPDDFYTELGPGGADQPAAAARHVRDAGTDQAAAAQHLRRGRLLENADEAASAIPFACRIPREQALRTDARDVILYELNEVPWSVVDYYVEQRPDSNFAALVKNGQSLTTVNSGPAGRLQPWRTWPTLHTSMYDHNSFDLGQDPDTFRGDPIWDVAEKAGLNVGLFGPLQSWPARKFAHGGFYIPDTFSQDSKTYPESLRGFQDFNLSMTRKMGFDSNVALNPRMLAGAGLDLLRHGSHCQVRKHTGATSRCVSGKTSATKHSVPHSKCCPASTCIGGCIRGTAQGSPSSSATTSQA